MRILVDMNLSSRWIDFLVASGYEAVHWRSIGKADAPDPEIMAYAKANGWLVLTSDLDFGIMLARSGDEQPTVLQIRAEDLRVETIGSMVLASLTQVQTLNEAGALATIGKSRTRLRLLPFPQPS